MSKRASTAANALRTGAMVTAIVLSFFNDTGTVLLRVWPEWSTEHLTWGVPNLVAFPLAIATCFIPGPSQFWSRFYAASVGAWIATCFAFDGSDYECVRNLLGKSYCVESDHHWRGL